MPPPNNRQIAWYTVAGGLVVTIGGLLFNAFVISPIQNSIKDRTEMRQQVHDLTVRVDNLEKWQTGMTRWRERVIATTGIYEMRRAMNTPIDTMR